MRVCRIHYHLSSLSGKHRGYYFCHVECIVITAVYNVTSTV